MDKIIKVENITFGYKNNKVFENFNLDIVRGSWTAIVGPNGGGKSTLLKLLLGELKYQGNIIVDNLELNASTKSNYYQKIYLLSENPDDKFISETVEDEIAFVLENKRDKDIRGKIERIARQLKITHLLKKSPYQLSGGEKQIVCIAAMLAHEPQIILMDETLNRIDFEQKEAILSILEELRQKKQLTIVMVTHNLEETKYANQMVVLDNGKIVLKGPLQKVLMEEKILNQLGVEIPFMISLSLKMNYYKLLKTIETDMNDMVKKIWL